MNRLLLTATLLAFSTSGIFAQNYNPKFDQGPDLKEFIKAATEDPAIQVNVPYPPIVVEVAKTISIEDEILLSLKKKASKPAPGYFWGPTRLWVERSVPYQNGSVYVPHLQGMEHPTAYKLLAQWDTINTTRSGLLSETDIIDPKDRALYAEAVQIDQNAAVLNQERDKINAEVAQWNQQCAGQYPTPQCTSWGNDLDRRLADLKRRIAIHNAKVENWRARKKEFDGVIETFANKVLSWGAYINDFVAKAEAYLSGYGTCTDTQHYQLQQVVNTACSPAIIRACKKGQSCDLLKENLGKFEACIKARQEINNTCYGGGDSGHNEAITIMTNGAENCKTIIKQDCGGRIGGTCNELRSVVFETGN